MIPPGALVMLTPLIVGIFFGVETLSGVLAGSLVSGVQVILELWFNMLFLQKFTINCKDNFSIGFRFEVELGEIMDVE